MYKKQIDIFDNEAEMWDAKGASDCSENINKIINLSKIEKNHKILDVGTGTGIIVKNILKQVGKGGYVKAIDISTKMIEVANRKLTADNLDFTVDNIETISDPDQTYDFIIFNNVFPHIINKDIAIKNAKRMLKNGGSIIISHLAGRDAVNNIHGGTSSFKEDRVPALWHWTKLLDEYNLRVELALDQVDFYYIIGRM